MDEIQSWRELLAQVIHNAQDRQLLAKKLGVHTATLTRWTQGNSQPRRDFIVALPDALPAYHDQFLALLSKAYPELFTRYTRRVERREDEVQQPLQIPSPFYQHVFHAHTTLPPQLREATVSTLLMQQLLTQLDPRRTGMLVFIVRCFPLADGRVCSLRKTVGRGTGRWGQLLEQQVVEHQPLFFGAESLAGQALIAGRTLSEQPVSHTEQPPLPYALANESILAAPILMNDRTAGCLCLISAESHHFSLERIQLVEQYVDMLAATLDPQMFVDLRSLQLAVMPPAALQEPIIAGVQERINATMLKTGKTRIETERIVWQELEQELAFLRHSMV